MRQLLSTHRACVDSLGSLASRDALKPHPEAPRPLCSGPRFWSSSSSGLWRPPTSVLPRRRCGFRSRPPNQVRAATRQVATLLRVEALAFPPGKFIKTATPVKHNRAKRRGPRRPCGAEPAGGGPVRPGQSPLGIETDDTGQLANDMKKRRGGAGRLWEGAQK